MEDDLLTGEVNEISTGYRAINNRKERSSKSENDYLISKEEQVPELEINDFSMENISELDQPLKEKYTIEYGLESISNKIYLNPFFLINQLKENLFKSEERNFPVNIGYPISNTYILSIDLNNEYEVEQLPKNRAIALAGDVGDCKVLYSYKNGKVNLRFVFKLTDSHFKTEEYQNLKEFYNQVVKVITKDAIVLKKL